MWGRGRGEGTMRPQLPHRSPTPHSPAAAPTPTKQSEQCIAEGVCNGATDSPTVGCWDPPQQVQGMEAWMPVVNKGQSSGSHTTILSLATSEHQGHIHPPSGGALGASDEDSVSEPLYEPALSFTGQVCNTTQDFFTRSLPNLEEFRPITPTTVSPALPVNEAIIPHDPATEDTLLSVPTAHATTSSVTYTNDTAPKVSTIDITIPPVSSFPVFQNATTPVLPTTQVITAAVPITEVISQVSFIPVVSTNEDTIQPVTITPVSTNEGLIPSVPLIEDITPLMPTTKSTTIPDPISETGSCHNKSSLTLQQKEAFILIAESGDFTSETGISKLEKDVVTTNDSVSETSDISFTVKNPAQEDVPETFSPSLVVGSLTQRADVPIPETCVPKSETEDPTTGANMSISEVDFPISEAVSLEHLANSQLLLPEEERTDSSSGASIISSEGPLLQQIDKSLVALSERDLVGISNSTTSSESKFLSLKPLAHQSDGSMVPTNTSKNKKTNDPSLEAVPSLQNLHTSLNSQKKPEDHMSKIVTCQNISAYLQDPGLKTIQSPQNTESSSLPQQKHCTATPENISGSTSNMYLPVLCKVPKADSSAVEGNPETNINNLLLPSTNKSEESIHKMPESLTCNQNINNNYYNSQVFNSIVGKQHTHFSEHIGAKDAISEQLSVCDHYEKISKKSFESNRNYIDSSDFKNYDEMSLINEQKIINKEFEGDTNSDLNPNIISETHNKDWSYQNMLQCKQSYITPSENESVDNSIVMKINKTVCDGSITDVIKMKTQGNGPDEKECDKMNIKSKVVSKDIKTAFDSSIKDVSLVIPQIEEAIADKKLGRLLVVKECESAYADDRTIAESSRGKCHIENLIEKGVTREKCAHFYDDNIDITKGTEILCNVDDVSVNNKTIPQRSIESEEPFREHCDVNNSMEDIAKVNDSTTEHIQSKIDNIFNSYDYLREMCDLDEESSNNSLVDQQDMRQSPEDSRDSVVDKEAVRSSPGDVTSCENAFKDVALGNEHNMLDRKRQKCTDKGEFEMIGTTSKTLEKCMQIGFNKDSHIMNCSKESQQPIVDNIKTIAVKQSETKNNLIPNCIKEQICLPGGMLYNSKQKSDNMHSSAQDNDFNDNKQLSCQTNSNVEFLMLGSKMSHNKQLSSQTSNSQSVHGNPLVSHETTASALPHDTKVSSISFDTTLSAEPSGTATAGVSDDTTLLAACPEALPQNTSVSKNISAGDTLISNDTAVGDRSHMTTESDRIFIPSMSNDIPIEEPLSDETSLSAVCHDTANSVDTELPNLQYDTSEEIVSDDDSLVVVSNDIAKIVDTPDFALVFDSQVKELVPGDTNYSECTLESAIPNETSVEAVLHGSGVPNENPEPEVNVHKSPLSIDNGVSGDIQVLGSVSDDTPLASVSHDTPLASVSHETPLPLVSYDSEVAETTLCDAPVAEAVSIDIPKAKTSSYVAVLNMPDGNPLTVSDSWVLPEAATLNETSVSESLRHETDVSDITPAVVILNETSVSDDVTVAEPLSFNSLVEAVSGTVVSDYSPKQDMSDGTLVSEVKALSDETVVLDCEISNISGKAGLPSNTKVSEYKPTIVDTSDTCLLSNTVSEVLHDSASLVCTSIPTMTDENAVLDKTTLIKVVSDCVTDIGVSDNLPVTDLTHGNILSDYNPATLISDGIPAPENVSDDNSESNYTSLSANPNESAVSDETSLAEYVSYEIAGYTPLSAIPVVENTEDIVKIDAVSEFDYTSASTMPDDAVESEENTLVDATEMPGYIPALAMTDGIVESNKNTLVDRVSDATEVIGFTSVSAVLEDTFEIDENTVAGTLSEAKAMSDYSPISAMPDDSIQSNESKVADIVSNTSAVSDYTPMSTVTDNSLLADVPNNILVSDYTSAAPYDAIVSEETSTFSGSADNGVTALSSLQHGSSADVSNDTVYSEFMSQETAVTTESCGTPILDINKSFDTPIPDISTVLDVAHGSALGENVISEISHDITMSETMQYNSELPNIQHDTAVPDVYETSGPNVLHYTPEMSDVGCDSPVPVVAHEKQVSDEVHESLVLGASHAAPVLNVAYTSMLVVRQNTAVPDIAHNNPESEVTHITPPSDLAYNTPVTNLSPDTPVLDISHDTPESGLSNDSPELDGAYQTAVPGVSYDTPMTDLLQVTMVSNGSTVSDVFYGTQESNAQHDTPMLDISHETSVPIVSPGITVKDVNVLNDSVAQDVSLDTPVSAVSYETTSPDASHYMIVSDLSLETLEQGLAHENLVPDASPDTSVPDVPHDISVPVLSNNTSVSDASHGNPAPNVTFGTLLDNISYDKLTPDISHENPILDVPHNIPVSDVIQNSVELDHPDVPTMSHDTLASEPLSYCTSIPDTLSCAITSQDQLIDAEHKASMSAPVPHNTLVPDLMSYDSNISDIDLHNTVSETLSLDMSVSDAVSCGTLTSEGVQSDTSSPDIYLTQSKADSEIMPTSNAESEDAAMALDTDTSKVMSTSMQEDTGQDGVVSHNTTATSSMVQDIVQTTLSGDTAFFTDNIVSELGIDNSEVKQSDMNLTEMSDVAHDKTVSGNNDVSEHDLVVTKVKPSVITQDTEESKDNADGTLLSDVSCDTVESVLSEDVLINSKDKTCSMRQEIALLNESYSTAISGVNKVQEHTSVDSVVKGSDVIQDYAASAVSNDSVFSDKPNDVAESAIFMDAVGLIPIVVDSEVRKSDMAQETLVPIVAYDAGVSKVMQSEFDTPQLVPNVHQVSHNLACSDLLHDMTLPSKLHETNVSYDTTTCETVSMHVTPETVKSDLLDETLISDESSHDLHDPAMPLVSDDLSVSHVLVRDVSNDTAVSDESAALNLNNTLTSVLTPVSVGTVVSDGTNETPVAEYVSESTLNTEVMSISLPHAIALTDVSHDTVASLAQLNSASHHIDVAEQVIKDTNLENVSFDECGAIKNTDNLSTTESNDTFFSNDNIIIECLSGNETQDTSDEVSVNESHDTALIDDTVTYNATNNVTPETCILTGSDISGDVKETVSHDESDDTETSVLSEVTEALHESTKKYENRSDSVSQDNEINSVVDFVEKDSDYQSEGVSNLSHQEFEETDNLECNYISMKGSECFVENKEVIGIEEILTTEGTETNAGLESTIVYQDIEVKVTNKNLGNNIPEINSQDHQSISREDRALTTQKLESIETDTKESLFISSIKQENESQCYSNISKKSENFDSQKYEESLEEHKIDVSAAPLQNAGERASGQQDKGQEHNQHGEEPANHNQTQEDAKGRRVSGRSEAMIDSKDRRDKNDDSVERGEDQGNKCVICRRDYCGHGVDEHLAQQHICVTFLPAHKTQEYVRHLAVRGSGVEVPELVTGLRERKVYLCRCCDFYGTTIDQVRIHNNLHTAKLVVVLAYGGVRCHGDGGNCRSKRPRSSAQVNIWRALLHQSLAECLFCGHVFACSAGLSVHLRALHYTNTRCLDCGTSVECNQNVNHMLSHHHNTAEADVSVDSSGIGTHSTMDQLNTSGEYLQPDENQTQFEKRTSESPSTNKNVAHSTKDSSPSNLTKCNDSEDKESPSKESVDKELLSKESTSKVSPSKESSSKDSPNKEYTSKESPNKESPHKDEKQKEKNAIAVNAYNNHLNYQDGKVWRLQTADRVDDSSHDRAYLQLPIVNIVPLYAEVSGKYWVVG